MQCTRLCWFGHMDEDSYIKKHQLLKVNRTCGRGAPQKTQDKLLRADVSMQRG